MGLWCFIFSGEASRSACSQVRPQQGCFLDRGEHFCPATFGTFFFPFFLEILNKGEKICWIFENWRAKVVRLSLSDPGNTPVVAWALIIMNHPVLYICIMYYIILTWRQIFYFIFPKWNCTMQMTDGLKWFFKTCLCVVWPDFNRFGIWEHIVLMVMMIKTNRLVNNEMSWREDNVADNIVIFQWDDLLTSTACGFIFHQNKIIQSIVFLYLRRIFVFVLFYIVWFLVRSHSIHKYENSFVSE